MAVIEIAKIQVRRGQENTTGVPQLDPGEFGWAQDTEHLYIGKRIAEGAPDDLNTRILTENDLNSFFAYAQNTGTQLTTYKYRDGVAHIVYTTTSTVQKRLDSLDVSLESFGVVPSVTATDITTLFQNAVEIIFNNPSSAFAREDSRRRLRIPPGNYFISEAIELPPYAVIEGESKELTKLTLINNISNIFKTIDQDGNDFPTNSMQSGVKRSRGVHISNMTLEYHPSLGASNNALVSFDNTLNSTIEKCNLRTAFDTTSTTTYGLVTAGVGVEIRGTGGGLGAGTVNLCENVSVKECNFDSLNIGVRSTGSVIRPVVYDNVFSNMNRGVEFGRGTLQYGPNNGIIKLNRFESVTKEGVFIGTNTNGIFSNHFITDNFFIQVGNGPGLSDYQNTSTNASPIITLHTYGNKTVNNYFHRKYVADVTSTSSFYYNPLVYGSAIISDSSIFTATIASGTSTSVVKIPMNGKDQMVNLKYQLTRADLSRKGTLIFNIAPDGFPGIFDIYSYIETLPDGVEEGPDRYFDADSTRVVSNNYIALTFVNTGSQCLLEYQVDIMT